MKNRFYLIVAFSVLTILFFVGLFVVRSHIPGIQQTDAFQGIVIGTEQQFETTIPFAFDDIGISPEEVVELTIPLTDHHQFTVPGLLILRPYHYLEVSIDNEMYSPPVGIDQGRDAVLVWLPHVNEAVIDVKLLVKGAYGQAGIGDIALVGEANKLARYLRVRTAISIFLIAIMLSGAVGLVVLMLFRPNPTYLSTAGFALSLMFVAVSNVDVWYLISSSLEGQLRFKAFAVAMSIVMSFRMLHVFVGFPSQIASYLSMGTLALGLGSFLLPSIAGVMQLSTVIYGLSIPLMLIAVSHFIRAFHERSSELTVYMMVSSVLLLGGVFDILALFAVHVYPPITPFTSVLFLLGVTVLFVMQSSDFAGRYRTLVNKSMDAILITNSQGDILECNPLAIEWGFNKGVPVFYTCADFGAYWNERANKPVEFEARCAHRVVDVYMVPYEANWMIVMRDVSLKKAALQAEVDKVRLDTMEKVSGGIAHDFNNLFMALGGQVSLLEDSNAAERVQKIYSLLESGSQSVRRLQTYIRGEETILHNIVLQDWLEEHLALFNSVLPEDAQVFLKRPYQLISMSVNSTEFEQIFLNLLFNAGDAIATTKFKSVWIDIEIVSSTQISISIEDSGAGVLPHLRNRLFVPFVSSKDGSTTSGLGLSIVQQALQNHDASIELTDSIHGQGARFTMMFHAVVSERIVETSECFDVLVLEDEPLIRDVLEAHLMRGGYKVFAVGTVEEAAFILDNQAIGCIVSDVVLGDRTQDNGIAFCKTQVQRGYSKSVVIISGFIPEESASLPPGWLFLSKPFRGIELMECISKVLPLPTSPSQV